MNKKFTLLVVITSAVGCMQDIQSAAPSQLTQKQPFTFNGYVYQLSVQAYAGANRMLKMLQQGKVTEVQLENFLKKSDENPKPVQAAPSTDLDAQIAPLPAPAPHVMSNNAEQVPAAPAIAAAASARPKPPVAPKPKPQGTPQSTAASRMVAAPAAQVAQMCPSGRHQMPSACACASASAMATPQRLAPIIQDALSAQRISIAMKQKALSRITDAVEKAIAIAEIARLQELLEAASVEEAARLTQDLGLGGETTVDEEDEDLQQALEMSMGVRPADQSYTEKVLPNLSPEQYALSQMTPKELEERTQALIAQELAQERAESEAATLALLEQEAKLAKAARLERILEAYSNYRTLKAGLDEEDVISMVKDNFEQAEQEALLAALISDIEEAAGIALIKELLQ